MSLVLNFSTLHLKIIFTHIFSGVFILHASALNSAVGIPTPSYRHYFAFIPNPLLINAFSAFLTLYTPHSLCPTSLSNLPFAATCDSQARKTIKFRYGCHFVTSIRPTITYLAYLITLLLTTFTLNHLLSYTLLQGMYHPEALQLQSS